MTKLMQAPITLVLALIFVGSSMETAPAAILRDRVTVESDRITLADLFTGIGKQAGIVVGTAPRPGRRQIFGSHRLTSLAKTYKLDWKASGRYDRVTVVRASRTIEIEEIEQSLKRMLVARGVPADRIVEITNRNRIIKAATGTDELFRIRSARLNDRGDRFTAVVEIATGDMNFDQLQFVGKVFALIRVPVLSRRFRNGDIIRDDDLIDVSLPQYKVRRDVILDRARIIGLTPRRFLDQGVPLGFGDIRRPVIVARGKMVMLVIKTDRMLVTARGRALHDAAKGDMVRVVNTRSNFTVEGLVVGPGRVSISHAPSIQ